MIKKDYMDDFLEYGLSYYMSTYDEDDRRELENTLNDIESLESLIRDFIADGMPCNDKYERWFDEALFPKEWTPEQRGKSILSEMQERLQYYKEYYCDYCNQCREKNK